MNTTYQGRDYGKSQWIRLADVVFVGPVMTYAGGKLVARSAVLGWTLVALGLGTIGLNGYNFLRLGGFAQARREI